MAPGNWKPLYYNTLDQVAAGDVSIARINEAVERILVMKMRAGLFNRGLPLALPMIFRSNWSCESPFYRSRGGEEVTGIVEKSRPHHSRVASRQLHHCRSRC